MFSVDRVVIIRPGELTVKGGFRAEMERLLLKAAREAAGECGGAQFEREPGRFYAQGDVDCLKRVLARVFGVKSVSPAYRIQFAGIGDIVETAVRLWGDFVSGRRFAVRVHRVGPHGFTSRDVAAAIGAALVERGGVVDLETPQVELFVEVRGNRAFFYEEVIEGPGGLPLGSEGKVLALVSGGIDSPVAAWLMMRRGAHVDVFHCALGGSLALSRTLQIVEALLSWSYGYNAKVIIADCGPIARAIRREVKEELWNIAFKRALYLAAAEAARRVGATALVTGESLGQVSSQTLQALAATEDRIDMPIFRPLIGFDKDEIVKLAQKIGAYELSTKLPEYCALLSRRPRKWAFRHEIEEIDLAVRDSVREAMETARVIRKSEIGRFMLELAPPSDIEVAEIPPDAIVVDLRDEESYKKWHLPGALRAEPERALELVDKLGRDKTYVFYCHAGSTSLEVAETLRKFGIKAFSLGAERRR